MNKQIHDEVLKIEEKGLTGVELLALVTDSSYEVVFYANYNGKVRQSWIYTLLRKSIHL